MRNMRWRPLVLLILAFLLLGPTIGYASGSDSIPQVTPYDHPTLGPGLFFPEQAARENDALTEAALAKVALYERALADLRLTLEATEAQLVIAKDSTQNLRDLVPRAQRESYRQGFRDGRVGFGIFAGYDPFNNNPTAGVGIYYGF